MKNEIINLLRRRNPTATKVYLDKFGLYQVRFEYDDEENHLEEMIDTYAVVNGKLRLIGTTEVEAA
jgi:hypothetical protein